MSNSYNFVFEKVNIHCTYFMCVLPLKKQIHVDFQTSDSCGEKQHCSRPLSQDLENQTGERNNVLQKLLNRAQHILTGLCTHIGQPLINAPHFHSNMQHYWILFKPLKYYKKKKLQVTACLQALPKKEIKNTWATSKKCTYKKYIFIYKPGKADSV